MEDLSKQCLSETNTSDDSKLSKFNDYFFDKGYDAFVVDKEVNGNLLFFTLVYSYQKLAWEKNLPSIDLQKFKNLAFQL